MSRFKTLYIFSQQLSLVDIKSTLCVLLLNIFGIYTQ
nr:MAG TPA: hypothetical protein [Bacteriophage sp.]